MSDDRTLYQEDEISFSALFWAVMSKWRTILAWALILCLVFGGLFALREALAQRDPDYMEGVETLNTYLQMQDAAKLESLENAIHAVSDTLEQQKAFCENSVLMQVNPYEIYTVYCTYYVDADYQILPENTYQDTDPTAAIVNAYAARLGELNVTEALFDEEAFSGNTDYDWNKFFLKIGTWNAAYGMLRVDAYGATREQAEQIMALAEETLEQIKPEVEAAVHEHTLTCLSKASSAAQNEELISFQQQQRERIASLTNDLETLVKEYSEFEAAEQEDVGTVRIVKKFIKFGVVGAVLGAVCSAGWYLLAFLFGDYVLQADELERRYGKAVLGVSEVKNKATRLDCWIGKHRGIPTAEEKETEAYLLAARMQHAAKGAGRVCLVGTADQGVLDRLCEQLAATGRLTTKPLACGSMKTKMDTIRTLDEADVVFLAEELTCSRHAKIRSELSALRSLGKDCAGFVLLGKVGK